MRAIQNLLFIDFEPLCQKLWVFCQILAFFTMPARQIWSCHVTQEANFENLLLCPTSTFNIEKSHKTSSGKANYFRSYKAKASRGGVGVENTPQCLRVKLKRVPRDGSITSEHVREPP